MTASLFFSPVGSSPLVPSGSRLAASASSSQASSTGFRAIMLLWDSVRDSNLGTKPAERNSERERNFITYRQIVLWLSAPTPGSLRLASALPTSAWVTPSLIRRCLNRSAKASEHSVILSYIGRMFVKMLKWMCCDVVNITVQCLALSGQCPRHSEALGGREGDGGGGGPGGGGTSCLHRRGHMTHCHPGAHLRGPGTSSPWPGAGWGGGSWHSPASSSVTQRSSLECDDLYGTRGMWRQLTWRHHSAAQHVKAHFMFHLKERVWRSCLKNI